MCDLSAALLGVGPPPGRVSWGPNHIWAEWEWHWPRAGGSPLELPTLATRPSTKMATADSWGRAHANLHGSQNQDRLQDPSLQGNGPGGLRSWERFQSGSVSPALALSLAADRDPSWPIRQLASSLSFSVAQPHHALLPVFSGCLRAMGEGWAACLGALRGGPACAGMRGLGLSGVLRPAGDVHTAGGSTLSPPRPVCAQTRSLFRHL